MPVCIPQIWMEQCLDPWVLWLLSQAQQKDPERISWNHRCPSCDHSVQAKHSQFHLTLQDCFHWGLDPIERSTEDLPKDLLSQLILKATPAPVLPEIKGPKPELPACKREFLHSFSCEFSLGKGQRSCVFDTTSVKTNFLMSLLLSAKDKTMFS